MTSATQSTYQVDFAKRSDLEVYKDNAHLLFALMIKYQLDDIHSVAADSLTDGNNDKKCDLIYIDQDAGQAVIAQGYYCHKENVPPSAPANKASDLNTGVSWLLNRQVSELPQNLQSAASTLRNALKDGTVTSVEAWYVHNLEESANVQQELKTVEQTLGNSLTGLLGADHGVSARAIEVGNQTLEEWYKDLKTNILIADDFVIDIPGGYEINEDMWSAYVTAIPGRWLFDVYKIHKDKLFSANVRNYLGSRKSDSNINHRIKETANNSPENFWAYNNGLTVLVHTYEPKKSGKKTKLCITGLSIVNGAQTTGAIGSLGKSPRAALMIPARFVKCTDPATVEGIIRYNNSQNEIEAPDFRSNDQVQRRLRKEFSSAVPDTTYTGGRRGANEDVIKRPTNLVPSDTVAQALTAFHGNPIVAYNQKSKIWADNNLYSAVFNDHTNARHIVFVLSLLRAIESKKRELMSKTNLLGTEAEQLQFLRYRGANFLLVNAMASCIDIITSSPVTNKFRLSFGSVSPTDAESNWALLLELLWPFTSKLSLAVSSGFKNLDDVKKSVFEFRSVVDAMKKFMGSGYEEFARKVQH